MGIQINGASDKITSTDGSLSIEGSVGNITGNVTGPGNSSFLGLVGIGTNVIGAQLDVHGNGVPVTIDSANSNTYKIEFENDGTTVGYVGAATSQILFADASGGEMARFTQDGLKLPSGKGIDFSSGISSTTAEAHLLDDYEEGNWFGSLHYETDNTRTGGEGVAAISSNAAQYTRIGNLVFINCEFLTHATANYLYVKISGLPFVAAGKAELHVYVRGGLYRYSGGTASDVNFTARLNPGWTRFNLNSERTDLASSGWIQVRAASQQISISGCYLAT